jgi:hypothetical protein
VSREERGAKGRGDMNDDEERERVSAKTKEREGEHRAISYDGRYTIRHECGSGRLSHET